MNVGEMFDLMDLLIDKRGAPYYETDEKEKFLNLAQWHFVKTRYKEFEKTEKRKDDLRTISRQIDITGSGLGTFPADFEGFFLSLDLPVFKRVRYMFLTGLYLQIQDILREAKPLQIDDRGSLIRDPFNKPTDEFPLYTVRSQLASPGSFQTNTLRFPAGHIQILCDTQPTKAIVYYLKIPNPIQLGSDTLIQPPAVLSLDQIYYVVNPVTYNGGLYDSGEILFGINPNTFTLGSVRTRIECELPEHTHEEIVNIAVDLILTNTEDYQKKQSQIADEARME